MFWYQCRYCKVNFDQWEKLVTHRRDEHTLEFEALKRRSALLLKRQEEAVTARNQLRLENSENTNGIKTSSTSTTTCKMKPNTPSTSTPSSLSKLTTSPRRNQHPTSKELDAKDLENQEISLCIPSSSVSLRPSASSHFTRSSTPPYIFPTPTSSPRLNGNRTPYNRGKNGCNGSNSHSATSCMSSASSFLTPPGTPLQSFTLASPYEELSLNANWSPPVDLRKAVHYHQMNDEDEIEICAIPDAGSCISVTKHSLPCSPLIDSTVTTRSIKMLLPPQHKNGTARNNQQQPSTSHVMIENLEDELQMPCSNQGTANTRSQPMRKVSTRADTAPPPPVNTIQRMRRRSHVEMLRSTGQRLKRLHSQLQLRQRTRSLFAPRAIPSTSSPTVTSSRGGIGIRSSGRANSAAMNGRNSEMQIRRLNRSSNTNTSTKVPGILRLTTRASARRPNLTRK